MLTLEETNPTKIKIYIYIIVISHFYKNKKKPKTWFFSEMNIKTFSYMLLGALMENCLRVRMKRRPQIEATIKFVAFLDSVSRGSKAKYTLRAKK